jgi:hypothetical protein
LSSDETSYEIEYDDGDVEKAVVRSRIRVNATAKILAAIQAGERASKWVGE